MPLFGRSRTRAAASPQSGYAVGPGRPRKGANFLPGTLSGPDPPAPPGVGPGGLPPGGLPDALAEAGATGGLTLAEAEAESGMAGGLPLAEAETDGGVAVLRTGGAVRVGVAVVVLSPVGVSLRSPPPVVGLAFVLSPESFEPHAASDARPRPVPHRTASRVGFINAVIHALTKSGRTKSKAP